MHAEKLRKEKEEFEKAKMDVVRSECVVTREQFVVFRICLGVRENFWNLFLFPI